jgi:hypothetical protein
VAQAASAQALTVTVVGVQVSPVPVARSICRRWGAAAESDTVNVPLVVKVWIV